MKVTLQVHQNSDSNMACNVDAWHHFSFSPIISDKLAFAIIRDWVVSQGCYTREHVMALLGHMFGLKQKTPRMQLRNET